MIDYIHRAARAIFQAKPDCAGKAWPFDTSEGRRAYPHNPIAAVDLCLVYARAASKETSPIIDAAINLVALWRAQKISGASRAERNCAIEDVRDQLCGAVDALLEKEDANS